MGEWAKLFRGGYGTPNLELTAVFPGICSEPGLVHERWVLQVFAAAVQVLWRAEAGGAHVGRLHQLQRQGGQVMSGQQRSRDGALQGSPGIVGAR